MMNYSSVSRNFQHRDTVITNIQRSQRGTKDYYLKVGFNRNLPEFIRMLNYLCLYHNIAIWVPDTATITRSTDVRYFFRQTLPYNTSIEDRDGNYTQPLLYDKATRDTLGLEQAISIQIVKVVGQITDTFESYIPEWARTCEATELLQYSLALKLTPKHRVRVYQRGPHFVIFTTKGFDSDEVAQDFVFIRKLWACIPLLAGWNEEKPELTELFKVLTNPDATEFLIKLTALYDTNEQLKNIKYTQIIETFNILSEAQTYAWERARTRQADVLADKLQQYTNALKVLRDYERRLFEAEQAKKEWDVNVIKTLVDKSIAYNLDTSYLQSNTSKLSYRVSAPLLNYDAEAAKIFFRRKVKNNYSEDFVDIFKALFVDEKVVLNFDQEVIINFTDGSIDARNGLIHGNDRTRHFPNPHHWYYNCWGSYGTVISELIQRYQIEELFYQVKTAVGSLNFLDPPVMDRFMEHLAGIVNGSYNPACFYWRDENCTTLHTFKETMEHLREETAE